MPKIEQSLKFCNILFLLTLWSGLCNSNLIDIITPEYVVTKSTSEFLDESKALNNFFCDEKTEIVIGWKWFNLFFLIFYPVSCFW